MHVNHLAATPWFLGRETYILSHTLVEQDGSVIPAVEFAHHCKAETCDWKAISGKMLRKHTKHSENTVMFDGIFCQL